VSDGGFRLELLKVALHELAKRRPRPQGSSPPVTGPRCHPRPVLQVCLATMRVNQELASGEHAACGDRDPLDPDGAKLVVDRGLDVAPGRRSPLAGCGRLGL
jgi:hypothetical protein